MMPDRVDELLTEQALTGVTDAERSELAALLDQYPEANPESFERAAAAAALVFLAQEQAANDGRLETMPTGLRQKIRAGATTYVSDLSPSAPAEPLPFRRPEPESSPAIARSATGGLAGWLIAAAAALVALVGWWPRLTGPTAPPEEPPAVVVDEPLSRVDRVAAASDLTVLPWNATEDEAARGAEGEVAWSATLQDGYMRIRGLAANDSTRQQYQLWIFDAERDDRYPVDGGVFDVPAGDDEVIVPIEAKLPVDSPVLFAVTVEPPGGVVVSSRERIVLAAQSG